MLLLLVIIFGVLVYALWSGTLARTYRISGTYEDWVKVDSCYKLLSQEITGEGNVIAVVAVYESEEEDFQSCCDKNGIFYLRGHRV